MTGVEDYFRRYFGPWAKRVEYPRTKKGEPATWVYEWPRVNFGMSTFTSVGYCDVEVPQTDPGHRIEFMFSAKEMEFEVAAGVILSACATPLNDGLALRKGHTIGPLHEPVGAGMTRLLLTTPWEKDPFGTIDLGDRHAEILMIVPLYENEYELLRAEGEDVLWEAIEAQGLEITNLDRASLVTKPAS